MTTPTPGAALAAMDDHEFLVALLEYIEQVEVQIESEWGICRSLEELMADGHMPPVYAEVLRRLGEEDA